MWFKITSKDLDNKINIHYLNNFNYSIKDSEGQYIDLKKESKLNNFINNTKFKSKKRVFKNSKVSSLRIQLGLKCNFSCKYCNQSNCRESFIKTSNISLPPEVTVRDFIKLLKKYNIQVTKQITLWGGEPLVYWKYIKILVPELKKLYPSIKLNIISNGSLLTETIIDFLIKYRITLTVSHDAQGFNAYRDDKDPLENPKIVKCLQRFIDASEESCKYWFSSLTEEERQLEENKIKYSPFGFSINVVITPANLDIDKIPGYFYLKLKRNINFHFESIVKADADTKQLMGPLDKEQKNKLTNLLFKKGIINSISPEENPFYSLREVVARNIHMLVNGIYPEDYDVICDVASEKTLAIDLQGNILACHGSDAKDWSIGHLSNVNTTINNKVIGSTQRPHCINCPLIAFCGGGCVIATNTDSQAMCEYLSIYHGALFAATWFAIFDTVIEKIEPCLEMEN